MKINEAILEPIITHLLQICKQELNLDELPEIEMVSEPSVAGGSSFGVFDGKIKVVSANRHPVDVMRTLAHELVHHKQRISGMTLDGNTGSEIENQANAVAGVIMRKFGKKFPHYFLETIPD